MKLIFALIIGILAYHLFWADDPAPLPSSTPGAVLAAAPAKQAGIPIDKTPDAQRKRKKLIEELIFKGVFEKVNILGSAPSLYVRPAYLALDFDTKQSFARAVYTYHFDRIELANIVPIYDSRTNTKIGYYSEDDGLRLD